MTASEAVDPGSTPGGPTTLHPTAKAPKPQNLWLIQNAEPLRFCIMLLSFYRQHSIKCIPALDKSAGEIGRPHGYPSPNFIH